MGHCKAGHRRLDNENSGKNLMFLFFDLNLILSSCNSWICCIFECTNCLRVYRGRCTVRYGWLKESLACTNIDQCTTFIVMHQKGATFLEWSIFFLNRRGMCVFTMWDTWIWYTSYLIIFLLWSPNMCLQYVLKILYLGLKYVLSKYIFYIFHTCVCITSCKPYI